MERFWAKVQFPTPLPQGEFLPEGCWVWNGARQERGYGLFQYQGKLQGAHRVSVKLSGREIPAGMVVDHLCRNHSCVNPTHLEVVTPSENTRRGDAFRKDKSHCIQGHAMTPENTLVVLYCRECGNNKQRRLRKQEKMISPREGV